MSIDLIVGLTGLVVAIIGTYYAISEYRKRHKTEHIFKTLLVAYPGSVAKIEQSCSWANTNVRDAVNLLNNFENSEAKQTLTKLLVQAAQDSKVSKELCTDFFNTLLANQDAQFKTRDVVYVQKDILQLCIDEARNNPPKPKLTPKWIVGFHKNY